MSGPSSPESDVGPVRAGSGFGWRQNPPNITPRQRQVAEQLLLTELTADQLAIALMPDEGKLVAAQRLLRAHGPTALAAGATAAGAPKPAGAVLRTGMRTMRDQVTVTQYHYRWPERKHLENYTAQRAALLTSPLLKRLRASVVLDADFDGAVAALSPRRSGGDADVAEVNARTAETRVYALVEAHETFRSDLSKVARIEGRWRALNERISAAGAAFKYGRGRVALKALKDARPNLVLPDGTLHQAFYKVVESLPGDGPENCVISAAEYTRDAYHDRIGVLARSGDSIVTGKLPET